MPLSVEDLQKMEEVLKLPLNIARRDYHWENEAKFNREFGLGIMAFNVPRLRELVALAKLGHAFMTKVKSGLDMEPKQGYTVISKVGDQHVNILGQRTAERDASEGRPDESVSETLRELPLPSVYLEAISRPERTWSGFARADDLRTQTEVPRAGSRQGRSASRYSKPETPVAVNHCREYSPTEGTIDWYYLD